MEIYGDESGQEENETGYVIFPIGGILQKIGELKVFTDDNGLGSEQEIFIRAAAGQIGIALDRELIYSEQEKTRLEVEREHLKSSMLRSISHDFRTPLTGIIGDCDMILASRDADEEEKESLVNDIREQSMWLTRTMENILSMTKLEGGTDFIDRRQEVLERILSMRRSGTSQGFGNIADFRIPCLRKSLRRRWMEG